MAQDAKISQIETLPQYAMTLSALSESVVANTKAFSNIMSDKYQELKRLQQRAEDAKQRLYRECMEAENMYVACNDEDPEYRESLLHNWQAIERKYQVVKYNCDVVTNKVHVAYSAVLNMINEGKTFTQRVNERVERGRKFIMQAGVQLEQYVTTRQ